MQTTVNTINLERFKNTALFSITLCAKFGNAAQIKDAAKLEAYLQALNADNGDATNAAVEGLTASSAKALKAGKRITARKRLINSPALDTLRSKMGEVKAQVLAYSMPSFFRSGMFVVKLDQVATIESKLNAAVAELQEKYIPDFLREYPEKIAESETLPVKQGGLGCLYDRSDYPTIGDLKDAFSIEWNWLTLGVPEGLPPELRAAEADKLQKKFSEAADEIKDALRVMFAEIVSHATEKLTTPPGEKPKVFRDSLVTNMREFCDTFSAKNIMDDGELSALVEKAKAVIGATDPQKLRDYANVREQTANALTEIKTQLDGMITTKGRKFDLDDE